MSCIAECDCVLLTLGREALTQILGSQVFLSNFRLKIFFLEIMSLGL